MGCKHKAILFYLPLSLKTLLNWEGFSSAPRWFLFWSLILIEISTVALLLNIGLVQKLECLAPYKKPISERDLNWNLLPLDMLFKKAYIH